MSIRESTLTGIMYYFDILWEPFYRANLSTRQIPICVAHFSLKKLIKPFYYPSWLCSKLKWNYAMEQNNSNRNETARSSVYRRKWCRKRYRNSNIALSDNYEDEINKRFVSMLPTVQTCTHTHSYILWLKSVMYVVYWRVERIASLFFRFLWMGTPHYFRFEQTNRQKGRFKRRLNNIVPHQR